MKSKVQSIKYYVPLTLEELRTLETCTMSCFEDLRKRGNGFVDLRKRVAKLRRRVFKLRTEYGG